MAFLNPRRARRVFAALAVLLFAACVFIASGPHRHTEDLLPFATTATGSVADRTAYHSGTAISPTVFCPLCDWLSAPSLPLVQGEVLCLPSTSRLQPVLARRSRIFSARRLPGRAASRAPPLA